MDSAAPSALRPSSVPAASGVARTATPLPAVAVTRCVAALDLALELAADFVVTVTLRGFTVGGTVGAGIVGAATGAGTAGEAA